MLDLYMLAIYFVMAKYGNGRNIKKRVGGIPTKRRTMHRK